MVYLSSQHGRARYAGDEMEGLLDGLMDPRLMELLQAGGDTQMRGMLQELQRNMEEDPDAVRAAAELAAREIGGDAVGAIDALAAAAGGGIGGIGRAMREGGGGRVGAGAGRIQVGDRVQIRDDVEMNRRLANGHGGWVDDMANFCGDTGECTRIDPDGDVHVRFASGRSYCWHPDSVISIHASGGVAFDTSWHAGLNTPPPFAPWRLECYRLKYATELETLAERGFPELLPGIRALRQNNGDVDMAQAVIETAQVAAHEARSSVAAARSAPEVVPEPEPEPEEGGSALDTEPDAQPEPESQPEHHELRTEEPEIDRYAWLVGLTLSQGDPAPSQLCNAVLAGDSRCVARYLEQPGNTVDLWFVNEDVPEPGCFSLLMVAAVEGHVDICRMLAGENVNKVVRGATPLQLAVWAGQLEAVKVLHECGARVDFVSTADVEGTAIRSYRVSGAGSGEVNGTYRPVTLPRYSGAQPYSNGTITMFRWQREFWALSNLGTGQDNFDQGQWLYSCAAESGAPPMEGWTTFRGVEPAPNIAEGTTNTNPTSRSAEVGRMGTALWLAASAGHAEISRWLLLNGAPVDSVGPQGDTALKVAERDTTSALCSAVFEGAKFWARVPLREAEEVFEADGELRHGVVCDRSGVDIVGPLYHLRGFNYDLCEAEYIKLSDADKAKYECIMRPPKLLFDSDLRQLCESQQRTDLCDFIGLRDESLRVRARQRLAWATNLISDYDCVVVELDVDVVSRVAQWTGRLKRSSAPFNLKVLREESRAGNVSSTNLKRLRSVERQLMPGGLSEIHDMLEAAGLTRPDAHAALLNAVQVVARDQRPPVEGLYKCTQQNGVAIRIEPKEGTKTEVGPSCHDVIAVETIFSVRTEVQQNGDHAQAIERDIAAALSQLRDAMGDDLVRDMTQEMQNLPPSEQLGCLMAMGVPLELPSASPAPLHEIEYLKLVGGGFCPMKLPHSNNSYFQRQGGFADSGDPMDSPALCVCASRTVAQNEQPDTLTLCEWRRFQRFAAVWPGRPECLSTRLSPELSTLPSFLVSAKLDGYAEQLSALGLELGDCPFISVNDLETAIPKEFHRKRLRRLAQRLPLEPAVAASAEDVAHLTSTTAVSDRSHHLLGNTAADNFFRRDVVKFRRIRQLADGSSDELERERRIRGKFCGRFGRGSARAEMNTVRQSALWDHGLRGPLDVRAKIDALWAGERHLATLQRGLGADGSRLMELILYAEDDVWDEPVGQELHDDQPKNSGEGSAQLFFDKNSVHLVRIRQLADPERAMVVQPRFNQNGYEDERNFVRSHYVPTWRQIGWDLGKPIERLWQGERNLEVLGRGCDNNTAQLVALLLAADDHTEAAVADGTGHVGEWRGDQYSQWCSAPGREEGPLCTHLHRTSGIVKQEHWSCCGMTDRSVRCPLAGGGDAVVSARDCCSGGHGLTENTTPRAGFGCDICHRDLPTATRVHSCRQCNYDVCHECFAANRGDGGGSGSTAGGGGASPAALDVVPDDDPVVQQLVGFGFQVSQAKFAMARGKEQGISARNMVEACADFILENPDAGLPPRLRGGALICPDGHVINPTPNARYDTVCDVCYSRETHHVCQHADRHYDVCASCYNSTLNPQTMATSATTDSADPMITPVRTPPPRNPAAEQPGTSAPATRESRVDVPEDVPPSAPAQQTPQDREAMMRAARLARFG